MPALDFPASPTNGQVYGQYTYDATKGAWRVTGLVGTSVVSSATPPASPVAGMLWFNTNDGVLFTYFNDGDTSQWVEVKSNTASGSTVAARVDALEAKPNGLVPIIPTSIDLSSGTATVNSSGVVTFTNTLKVSLNGVFSSLYRDYRILVHAKVMAAGTTGIPTVRYRASGTDNSSANYYFNGVSSRNSSSPTSSWQGNGRDNQDLGRLHGGMSAGTLEIQDPYDSTVITKFISNFNGGDTTSLVFVDTMGVLNVSTAVDGFSFYDLNGGTVGGSFQVFGYRN